MVGLGQPQGVEQRGKYTRRDSVVYIRSGIEGNNLVEYRIDDKQFRAVERHWEKNKSARYHTFLKPNNVSAGTCDLYTFFLFHFAHHSEPRILTASEYYGKVSTSLHSDSVNGRRCIRVDVKDTYNNTVIRMSNWHDVERGYLIIKQERKQHSPTAKFDLTIELDDWIELGAAYFPKRFLATSYLNGNLNYTQTIDCTTVSLNEPVSDKELVLPNIPDNTTCVDYIRMKQYLIDSSWNRSGPEKDFVIQKMEAKQSSLEAIEDSGGKVTTSEPWSLWTWISLVSGGLFVLGLLILFWKRWFANKISLQ